MDKEFNEDMACYYTRVMWLKLAHKLSDDVFLSSNPDEAIRIAMMADACYWQATGTADPITVKEFIKGNI